ncbi:DnaD domain-containing protein [Halobacillus litoralis]|uniref:DnaD domain-containing protein n=1 Tax=Halobacillus litoralis TaxID=45668 RepID=UPI001CD5132A|nr:DnaD domain-containing protein [Halobacillus litoralis]MCA0970380.1 DnaD domain-containing protein [Halobacillus litoralis]
MGRYQSYQQMMDNQLTIPGELLTKYVSLGIAEQELVLILQIHRFRSKGNSFPTPEELAEHVSLTSQQCSQILRRLIQKQFLTIEQKKNEQQIINETYSLEPLWEKLFQEKPKTQEPNYDENIFPLFEQEFGRPLSPFEIETISIWLDEDEQSPALIKAALREAVLMGKLNFKYIDRILREWSKKGVRTVEQAREHGKQFRQQGSQPKKTPTSEKRDVSLYYNWLEED